MKELTKEQKARAYNKALETARALIAGETETSAPVFYVDNIKDIFPELKESEDEQSKNWILEYLHDGLRKSDEQFKDQFKCAIAWLEKQGEQKVIIPKFRVGDVIRYDEDGEINRVIEIVEEGYKLEHGTHILCFHSQDNWELIEQKPADKVEPKFSIGDKIQYSSSCGTIMTIEKIENGEYIFSNDKGHVTIESGNKWYLVKPVEQNPIWSEEDERLLNNMVLVIQDYYNKEDAQSLICWLKSLKPKKQWKPSEEQLDALREALAHIPDEYDVPSLTELFEQLKQL